MSAAAPELVVETPRDALRPLPRRPWRPRIGTIATAVAILPILIATIGAVTRGWVALGDNGLLLVRTEDVLTSHHPLLGTWTSASMAAGRAINNPGPLWFDLLAPFVRLGGPSAGLAAGVAIANAACASPSPRGPPVASAAIERFSS